MTDRHRQRPTAVRLSQDLLIAIDEKRGTQSRHAFIINAVTVAVVRPDVNGAPRVHCLESCLVHRQGCILDAHLTNPHRCRRCTGPAAPGAKIRGRS